ncbi:MAG TPA: DUF192 domain-containing protein, partial [Caulobacteraceae bacterium]
MRRFRWTAVRLCGGELQSFSFDNRFFVFSAETVQMLTRRFILGFVLALAANCPSPSLGAESVGSTYGLPTYALKIVTHDGHVHRFRVEIADNAASRARGLMFRRSLAPDAGMLFDFKTPQHVSFWMKNTLIPLDILFLDKDGYIINLAVNAPPLSQTNIPSGGAVLGVLEIGGG